MADLQSKISEAQKKQEKQPAEPAQENELKSSGEYLKELKDLSENEEFQRSAPPDSRASLAEAMEKARELYKEKASQNQWGEVAQLIARSVIQFGAARDGLKSGHDMSGVGAGVPMVDFNARTDRAYKEYQDSIRNSRDLSDDDRTRHLDTEAGKKDNFGKREGYLQEALRSAKNKEDNDAALAREKAREAAQRTKDNNRDSKEDERYQLSVDKMNLGELKAEEKNLQTLLKNRQILVNQLQTEDDLSNKSLNKLQEKYAQTAAAGDMDLTTLKGELEATDEDGTLWGKNPNPQKRKEVLDSKVTEVRNMLQAVQAKKQDILKRQPTLGVTEPQTAANPPSAPKSMSKDELTAYASKYKMSEEGAKSFLESQGYKVEAH
jgi:hypothetical protein